MKKNELKLPNLGVFISKLPNNLFHKIKNECLNFCNKKEFTSAMSAKGVPKHYYLEEETDKELLSFLTTWVEKYFKKYRYLQYYKILNKNAPTIFKKPWINIQKKGEFCPNHLHDGILSYSIWIQLPPSKKNKNETKFDSCFEFQYQNILGAISNYPIHLNKSYEGKFVLFPAGLLHCVYPFYDSDEIRISVNGNICFDN